MTWDTTCLLCLLTLYLIDSRCKELLQQLDAEVIHWKAQLFAKSTKSTYSAHLRIYLKFCQRLELPPVPVSTCTLERYAAFLARTRAFTTVQQYMNIIRIIHLEFGFSNPLSENWHLRSVLQGIKRGKGVTSKSKSPILPEHLLQLHKTLDLDSLDDLQLWSATLTAFFGLLRVSNVAAAKTPSHMIKRKDMDIHSSGITLSVHHSKTIQYKERNHTVVLPYLRNHTLCPTTAVLKFLGKTARCPQEAPLFSTPRLGHSYTNLTAARFRERLCSKLRVSCPSEGNFSTHSLRRGGATWLLSSGTPLASIKIIGDWSSDAVYRYLIPSTKSQFSTILTACDKLPIAWMSLFECYTTPYYGLEH